MLQIKEFEERVSRLQREIQEKTVQLQTTEQRMRNTQQQLSDAQIAAQDFEMVLPAVVFVIVVLSKCDLTLFYFRSKTRLFDLVWKTRSPKTRKSTANLLLPGLTPFTLLLISPYIACVLSHVIGDW